MSKIAKVYGVSIGTVHTWLHALDIPTRPTGSNALVRRRRGVTVRLCRGVLHPEGVWLEQRRFHTFMKHNALVTRTTCMGCDFETKEHNPYVLFTLSYRAWVKSIVNRIGVMEACRRLNIHDSTLRGWLSSRRPKRIRRENAKSIVEVITNLRETGEVIHRDSISYGALARGLPSKPVTARTHLYTPHGDSDTELRRKSRLTSK